MSARALGLLVGLCTLSGLGVGLGLAHAAAAAVAPTEPRVLAETRGDLDGDGRAERITAEADGTLVVFGPDGLERGRVRPTLPGVPRSAKIGVVEVEGHQMAHLRVELGRGRANESAVVSHDGMLVLLASDRTGPLGDGERSLVWQVDDLGLIRYQTSPLMIRCDGERRLFPERWDFDSDRFRPVDLDPPVGRALPTSAAAPPELTRPPLKVFRFVSASSDPTALSERRADLLAAPLELEDGKPETGWTAGPPGGGRGAWVSARATGVGARVSAIYVVPARNAGPRKLAVMLDREAVFTVALPAGSRPAWVKLPEGPPAECVSLVVVDPAPASAEATRLAEVEIYSELDRAGGVDELVSRVAESRADADGAAHLLAAGAGGPTAARAAAARLATASGPGKQRLIEILGALGVPETAPALGALVATAAAREREPLVRALAQLGSAGLAEAARLLAATDVPDEARVDAARILGRLATREPTVADPSVAELLRWAGRGAAPARFALRAALTTAMRLPSARRKLIAALAGVPAPGAASVRPEPDLPSPPEEPAVGAARKGDLARALAEGARSLPLDAQAEAGEALGGAFAAAPVTEFALRWRLLRAMADLRAPAVAPILERVALSDPDEFLRRAAVGAAASAGPGALGILEHGATDADPGVRRVALHALAGAAGAPRLLRALADDRWPMIRRTAAEGLSGACVDSGTVPALEGAVEGLGRSRPPDPAEEVRRAALVSLAHCAPGAPAIARVLGDERQPLAVRELGAALLGKGGDPGAASALARTAEAVLSDPRADERSAGLAVACVRALGRLQDRSRPVLEALGAASNEPTAPTVRAAAMEAIGQLCPDGARVALERGLKDGDGQVRRAATAARARCAR